MYAKNNHPPGLYLVATPIGNLSDMGQRALDILRTADVIACEDRRVTTKLLDHYDIKKPLISYHEHNADRAGPDVIKRLQQSQMVALVSDAGTPLLSDPGYKLVQSCIDAHIHLSAIPGPSSILMALVLSGLPTDRFYFHGFLPSKTTARQKALFKLVPVPGSLVFLESPKRLAKSLADIDQVLGSRQCAVSRELTKLYEDVKRGSVSELAGYYSETGPPKGEITIVVGPATKTTNISDAEIDQALKDAFRTLSTRDAVRQVTSQFGLRKKTVYQRALLLEKQKP